MTTKTADNPQTEAGKQQYEAEKKVSDKSKAEYARLSKGKPTPTQEENDMAMCGVHILEHEPDGSDPDPNAPAEKDKREHEQHERRQSEAGSGGRPSNYQTRHQTPSKSTE